MKQLIREMGDQLDEFFRKRSRRLKGSVVRFTITRLFHGSSFNKLIIPESKKYTKSGHPDAKQKTYDCVSPPCPPLNPLANCTTR